MDDDTKKKKKDKTKETVSLLKAHHFIHGLGKLSRGCKPLSSPERPNLV